MKTIFKIAILLLAFVACDSDDTITTEITKTNLAGHAQKGPFNNGATVTVSELDDNLSPTGKNYYTEIFSDQGSFALNDIELVSPYVEIMVNGFYFNEVSGENSLAPLTLSTITKIDGSSNVNVNIISSLEKNRVKHLVKGGLEFEKAKKQAESEILKIFNIDESIRHAEYLDITQQGQDDAILLAISSLMQGQRTTSELSELIANMSLDLKTDGKLDDSDLQTTLINHAQYIRPNKIKENLISKYSSSNNSIQLPQFETYIQSFINKSEFTSTGLITYPQSGKHGINLLALDTTGIIDLKPNTYSLRAIPSTPGTVKVVIHFFDYDDIQNNENGWIINPLGSGWNPVWLDIENIIMEFTDAERQNDLDCKIELRDHLNAEIFLYEYDFSTPSKVMKIRW